MRRLAARPPVRTLVRAAGVLLAMSLLGGCLLPPTPETTQAKDVFTLYVVVFIMGAVVFFGVEGAIVYSIIRYRRRDDRLPDQLHGHTLVEILWTAIPTVIVMFLFVWSTLTLGTIQANSSPAVTVEVTVSVYALGALDPSQTRAGISEEELAAHRALAQLSSRLAMLESWLPASSWSDRHSQIFEPEAIRLLVRNADADPPDQSGITNQLVPWPGAGDPATFGEPATQPAGSRCGVVTGAEAATWFSALRVANQLTRFTAHSDRYAVNPRPLLPDESRSCPTP